MTDYALDFADASKASRKEDFLKGLEIETAMYRSLGAAASEIPHPALPDPAAAGRPRPASPM